jgi:hypothetical protein
LRSEAEASRAAIADCAKDGAKNFAVKMTCNNQCMAAMYFGPGYESRLRSAATVHIASQGLELDCRAQVLSGVCEVIYTGCSEPIFEEWRCPPGSHPVGGLGVGGCAPIGGGLPSSQPRAMGRWHKSWGAVAIAPSNGDIGVSTGKASKLEAEQEVTSSCRNGGAPDCRSELSYKD